MFLNVLRCSFWFQSVRSGSIRFHLVPFAVPDSAVIGGDGHVIGVDGSVIGHDGCVIGVDGSVIMVADNSVIGFS
jgi:hypothetical protein